MELWLIRHTTPKVNKGTCYGQLDLDVNSSFEKETRLIQDLLGKIEPDRVISSPLIRCNKLAIKLFPNHKIENDKRLMELHFGDWEGKPWANIPLEEIDSWANNFINNCPPNGETFQALINRLNDFEESLNTKNEEKIAIVTHSGVIRAFLMKYLNIPSDKIFSLQLNYGAIIKITINTEAFQQVEFLKG